MAIKIIDTLQPANSNIKLAQAKDIEYSKGESVQDVIEKKTVSSVTLEYALSTSATSRDSIKESDWKEEAPPREPGRYMWQRMTTTTPSGTIFRKYTCIAGADGVSPITVNIISSTGGIYISGHKSTTLTAQVREANIDITNQFPDNAFKWIKYDVNGDVDSSWCENNKNKGKSINITDVDVFKRALFNCEVDLDKRNTNLN